MFRSRFGDDVSDSQESDHQDNEDATHDNPESSPPPPRQRKKRGVTLYKKKRNTKLIRDRDVDFNVHGLNIGPGQVSFSNYIGLVTRCRVSILHESWDKVDPALKDRIWDEIKVT